ncbi:MAG: ATPase, T2SS/T4P/T4SS family [Candidatus Omnitrophota bacterium]
MISLEALKTEAKSLLKSGIIKHDISADDYLDPKHKGRIYAYLERILVRLSEKNRLHIAHNELKKIEDEIINAVFGFGIIEDLLQDPEVTDILVNNPDQIYVERKGKLEKIDMKFDDEEGIFYLIQRMLQGSGRRLDLSSAFVDFRVKDGMRVTAAIPPVSAGSPFFCIRKAYKEILCFEDLKKMGTLSQKLLDFLKYCVSSRINILVSGSTGVGKTTLMHLLINEFVPKDERIVLVEDTEEILTDHAQQVIRLITRSPNIEGKGEITLRDLVKLSLHLRPDRIVIGEVRGEEAFHFLHIINTGHEGSMCTVHASNPEDALNRLEVLSLMDRSNITPGVIRRFLKLGIDIIVQMMRLPSGQRIISQVSEFHYEGDVCKIKDIFSLEKSFRDGKEIHEIKFTGYIPSFADKLKARTDIAEDFFSKEN